MDTAGKTAEVIESLEKANVGKVGFLTALYIVIVPVFGIFIGKKAGKLIWASVLVALTGMYLLCIKPGFVVGTSDIYAILCAVVFALQILLVDAVAPKVDPIRLSCLQFAVCGAISWICALIIEKPDAASILRAWAPILYTGANPRKLGLPEEEALIGRGVHYCAACDGTFYKNKTVVLVGGGNSAAADALILSRVAEKVYLVHRRDTLRATKIYHEPLKNAENIEFVWDSVAEEILHEDSVTGVRVRNMKTGETKEISADGVFISIGRKPASEIFEGQLLLKDGYIEAGETTETNLPGVYAVGDVRTKLLRQVVTAAADGAVAVHMAEEYLAQQAKR